MKQLNRMWINQPSKLQDFNNLHGEKVLAEATNKNVTTIYFLKGNIVSMRVPVLILSKYWS